MKFLVDECCDAALVRQMRDDNFDVNYVAEQDPSITDKEVLRNAYIEKRVLITEDKDFGELVFRLQLPAHGVILLRFSIAEYHYKWPKLKELINMRGSRLKGNFIVLDKEKFRSHKLK